MRHAPPDIDALITHWIIGSKQAVIDTARRLAQSDFAKLLLAVASHGEEHTKQFMRMLEIQEHRDCFQVEKSPYDSSIFHICEYGEPVVRLQMVRPEDTGEKYRRTPRNADYMKDKEFQLLLDRIEGLVTPGQLQD